MFEVNLKNKTPVLAVVGLGYVGLPLARLFSTKYKVVGFDVNQARVAALMAVHDATLEVSDELLQRAIGNGLVCTPIEHITMILLIGGCSRETWRFSSMRFVGGALLDV